MSENIMIVLYWSLAIVWIMTVSISISFYFIKSSLRNIPTSRKLLLGFIFLGTLLTVDAIYWAFATTARVNILDAKYAEIFYSNWLVSGVKLLFLLAAVIFLYTLIKTFRQVEFQVEKLYFTKFVEHSVDAIGVLDPRGRVVYWNKGAENLYGYHRNFVKGKHIKEFLVPKKYHSHIDGIIDKIKNKTRKAERFIAPRLRFNQTEILVDITMTPFFHGNNLEGFFGIMRPYQEKDGMGNDTHITRISEVELPFENNKNGLYVELSLVLDESEKIYQRRRFKATVLTISLLFLTGIFVSLSLMSENVYQYIFGGVSFLSFINNFWPIKILLKKDENDIFKRLAIKKVINDRNLSDDDRNEAYNIIDALAEKLK